MNSVEKWFDTQRLDHFNIADKRTWSQRYVLNATFFDINDPSSPVFLMLGGEGPMSVDCANGHFITNEYGREVKALVICVEHRFYGKSNPLSTLETENLKYLNTEQALADYANFIQFIKKTYLSADRFPEKRKWVSFGGSYSGNLSAWLRLKYPHLIHAAIASSAPVVPQLRYPEYMTHVAKSIGDSCTKVLRQANDAVEKIIYSGTEEEKQRVNSLFQPCSPIQSDDDKVTFLSSLSDPVCGTVQYNLDNNGIAKIFNITEMCSIIQYSASEPMVGLANFLREYRKRTGDDCTDASFSELIKSLKDTRPYPENENAAGRSWTYQYCNEFGYIQYAAEGMVQPFSTKITFEWQMKLCDQSFDIVNFTPNIDEIINKFGSDSIRSSRITFGNGSIDPWSELGIKKSTSFYNEVAIPIENGAHCSNLYAPSANDSPYLKQARLIEWSLIKQWLKEDK